MTRVARHATVFKSIAKSQLILFTRDYGAALCDTEIDTVDADMAMMLLEGYRMSLPTSHHQPMAEEFIQG